MIFSGIQMSKKPPSSPAPVGAPAVEKKSTDGTQIKKKRPRFRAAMDQLALGTPSLGVAGNILS
jgi:hypothetical protein